MHLFDKFCVYSLDVLSVAQLHWSKLRRVCHMMCAITISQHCSNNWWFWYVQDGFGPQNKWRITRVPSGIIQMCICVWFCDFMSYRIQTVTFINVCICRKEDKPIFDSSTVNCFCILKTLIHLLQNAYWLYQNISADVEVVDESSMIYPHLVLWKYFLAYLIRLWVVLRSKTPDETNIVK